ncbi:hypothetical protein BDN72DRAFT_63824 [Pluteus cervinus]|uniref:Uncharacterized protein n=1 Tax=Pluteus cervinus TaxID=181527 RepID=A0ACD3AS52_9AGAR|nr:hypothetical protein BDN72DRAFT_63824 [Pluteus cervinus]
MSGISLPSPTVPVHTYVKPPASSSSSSPRLYPELVDIVIDHCHDDRGTLQALSFVCKDWLPSTRFHLFSQIKLTSHNYPTFLPLLTHPNSTLPHCISKLNLIQDINNEREWLNHLIPDLTILLPHTRSFTIVSGETKLTRNTRDALSKGWNGLTEISLKEASFRTFREFQDVMCGFPMLEGVELEGSWSKIGYGTGIGNTNAEYMLSWLPPPRTIPPGHPFAFAFGHDGYDLEGLSAHSHPRLVPSLPPRPSNTLIKLELTTCPTQDVLNWFMALTPIPLMKVLHLGHIISEEIPSISRYLRVCGDRLEELGLQPERQVQDILPQQIDLHSNTSIHTLTIDLSFCSQDFHTPLVVQILSQISRISLRTVTIIPGPLPSKVQTNHWSQIDDALSLFPYLTKVVVLTKCLPGGHGIMAEEPNLLRRCAEKGILRVGVRQKGTPF